MSEKTITIICSRPGMRRAGMEHPAKKTYPAAALSAQQLDMLNDDPEFQVIEGTVADAVQSSGDKELELANSKIVALKGEVERLSGNMTVLEGDKRDAEETAKKLADELDAAQTKITGLEDGAKAAKDASAKAAKDADDKIKALEAQVKKLEGDTGKAPSKK